MHGSDSGRSDVVRDIIRAGIQAPSADNSQPWFFKLDDDEITLWIDHDRTGLFFDADMAATFMSCGAVIENMRLKAQRHDLQLVLNYELNADPAKAVAVLKVRPGRSVPEELSAHIAARATHRGLYRKRVSVSDAARARIEAACDAVTGARIIWCNSDESRKLMTEAATGADLIRYTHPVIHRDFHAKLRFGHRAEETSDGLADDTLGIERVLLPFLRLLSPWPLARFFNHLGLHHFMAWRGCTLPMQTAPALGVLVCDPDLDYVQTGRALQRVWLAATAAGVDFQPMGALPLLLIRLHRLGGEGLNEEHITRLQELDRMWQSACGLNEHSKQLAMIFRIGHASKAAGRARRRPLSAFLAPPPASDR